jgi:hypothetical protein
MSGGSWRFLFFVSVVHVTAKVSQCYHRPPQENSGDAGMRQIVVGEL